MNTRALNVSRGTAAGGIPKNGASVGRPSYIRNRIPVSILSQLEDSGRSGPAAPQPFPGAVSWVPAAKGDFLVHMQQPRAGKPISERTLSDYSSHIDAFFRRFPEAEAGGQHLGKALRSYLTQPVAPATYNLRLTYLRAFLDFCAETAPYDNRVPENPLRDPFYRRLQDEGRFVHIPASDVVKLLKQPKVDTYDGQRDRVLLELQLDTGIRPSEALSLQQCDVNLEGRFIRVRAEVAKTRKERRLPISSASVKAIERLRRLQRWRFKSLPDLLFCRADGVRLSADAWTRRVASYSRKAGIKVRPYDLRHYFSFVYYQRSSHDLKGLQVILGHSRLEMTCRYGKVQVEDLVETHDGLSPIGPLLEAEKRNSLKTAA